MEPDAIKPEFEQSLLAMDRVKARAILESLLARQGATPLVERLVVPVLEKIGSDWEAGQLALSQVYMSGRICEELVDWLLPPASPDRKSQPKMAIATLEDYHLLGKRLVYSMLRASGYEVMDYGRKDVDGLVRKALEDRVELLLISTLMLNSALRVREVRTRLSQAGWAGKLVVGGAPFRFDPQLWREVGADASSPSAAGVVAILDRMVGGAS
jgi:methanogenic corrinoid protein MtbC1